MLKKKYLSFFILTFIVLINKNISAAPLCLEEDTNVQNKEITKNEETSKEDIETVKNNNEERGEEEKEEEEEEDEDEEEEEDEEETEDEVEVEEEEEEEEAMKTRGRRRVYA